VVLFGDEARRPYERPPLSKQVLTGDAEPESAELWGADWYREHEVELRLGQRVVAIDRSRHLVRTEGGSEQEYDRLLLATGARPKVPPLPGMDLAGAQTLRDVDDSLAIRDALARGARVVLVGGGYIGLEVAASAAAVGCEATVLEAADGLMRRQVAPEVGEWYRRLHRDRGITVHTGAKVRALRGDRHVEAVELDDGRRFDADLVVVGVGITPNVELAEQAGLSVEDGVHVDERGRTEDPAIFAAGDVANHPNPILGRRIRLESWQNAQNQARVAGQALAGADVRYAQVPWFWSDQHGVNLQMIGFPERWHHLVWRGDPDADPGFSVFYLDEAGRVVAANAIDRPGDIAPARKMIEKGLAPDPEPLADPNTSLKKILKAG
jgi:3-phenylpropionate/trans-cinnamate dioxygenase ferredoxin reductase subunit